MTRLFVLAAFVLTAAGVRADWRTAAASLQAGPFPPPPPKVTARYVFGWSGIKAAPPAKSAAPAATGMAMLGSMPAKASTLPVTAPAAPPMTAAFSPRPMFSQLLVKSTAITNKGRIFDFFIL